jgi:thiol:disulfide interchange protein DsbA
MMRILLPALLVITLAQPVLAAEPTGQATQAAAATCPPIANPNIVCRTYAPPQDESSSSSDSPLVIYFFSYTCFKCADFGDFVDAWSKRTKVSVLPVHALWGSSTVRQMAEAHYAFERLGVTETLGPRLFAAIKAGEYAFGGPDELARFAAANGVRGDLVKRALASPRNSFRVAIAERRTRMYQLDGVPFIAVNGRYGISLKSLDPQTLADLGDLLDALAAEARP